MKWTHEQLTALDSDRFENWHYSLDDSDQYRLTDDELGWLDFVKGRYCIYDHIMDNCTVDDDGHLWYNVNVFDMSVALRDDGLQHKAVCLSDYTSLQAIFFYTSFELEDEEEEDV